jgi:hypothetical protein
MTLIYAEGIKEKYLRKNNLPQITLIYADGIRENLLS